MRTSSSGFKRGLATVAVSALAVTGLPFLASSASAQPLVDQVADDEVVLVAPATDMSVKDDGVNQTVHLFAVGGTDVQQVRFEYEGAADASPTTIATVGRVNGGFSAEWAPPAALLNDPGTVIRAVGLSNTSIELDVEENTGVVSASGDSVDITNAPGSPVGVFQQPYAGPDDKLLGAVSGTTSDVTGAVDVELSAHGGGAPIAVDVADEAAGGTRGFSGVVDFSGYDFAGNPDEAAVHAVVGGGQGDDAEAVTLYQQTVGSVPQLDPISVQAGSLGTARVRVLDTLGNPVAGVQVIEQGGPTTVYTNSRGEAVFDGLAGDADGEEYTFVVNTSDNPDYESAIDFRRTVTVTEYTGAAQSLTATSKDGDAFDDQEFTPGDIQISVEDQHGNPLSNLALLEASWNVEPFEDTPGYPKDVAATVTDIGGGLYNVSFPTAEPSGTYTLSYYVNADGTPGQGPSDPAGEPLVVKAGEAALSWTDGATAQAPASTTATFAGALRLEDGTALPERTVALTWTATGDAIVAAQGDQPAGTTRNGNTSATAVTEADGAFGVAIVDPPASPKVDELDGALVAGTAFTPASPVLDVDFLVNTAPASVEVATQNLVDAQATPGRPVDLDVTVRNADGVELTDVPVTIAVDRGFLSPNAETAAELVPDPAPGQDGLYGEWKSDGTEQEYTTDDSGVTGAVVAIEDDPAFATSPTVDTTVTITAGDVTETETVTFTSTDPLNGGEVRLELADEADQSVSVLPKAPTTETVRYDLFVEDQFGNLVRGEPVTLTDDLTGAEIEGVETNVSVASQLADDAPAVELSSSVEGSQTVRAEWVVDSNTWTDGDLVTPGLQPVRDADTDDTTLEGEAAPVDWYAIDYAASSYGMTDNGEATNKVGRTVVVTYRAVDQHGEPIEDLQVNFFRAGPDDEQDGAGDAAVETDANGEATYVFQGIRPGSAIIETVVREPAPSTTIIPAATVNHVVKFGKQKKAINARLKARSKGNKDVLIVKAPRAARGAKVVFYAELNGKVVKVGKATLNKNGRAAIRVRDRNRNRKTAYAAIVRATKRTLSDTTNVRRVK